MKVLTFRFQQGGRSYAIEVLYDIEDGRLNVEATRGAWRETSDFDPTIHHLSGITFEED